MVDPVALPHDKAGELPEAVLTELGRLTWSAIHLDDLTDALCRQVEHKERPREDRRPIGRKIDDALKALGLWEGDESEAGQIRAWLLRAQRALEKRNAVLHSVPLIVFDERSRRIGHALGEMPRGERPYYERWLGASELREVREELDGALEGWTDAEMFAFQHHTE